MSHWHIHALAQEIPLHSFAFWTCSWVQLLAQCGQPVFFSNEFIFPTKHFIFEIGNCVINNFTNTFAWCMFVNCIVHTVQLTKSGFCHSWMGHTNKSCKVLCAMQLNFAKNEMLSFPIKSFHIDFHCKEKLAQCLNFECALAFSQLLLILERMAKLLDNLNILLFALCHANCKCAAEMHCNQVVIFAFRKTAVWTNGIWFTHVLPYFVMLFIVTEKREILILEHRAQFNCC